MGAGLVKSKKRGKDKKDEEDFFAEEVSVKISFLFSSLLLPHGVRGGNE
jgi:hypothetical protein